MRRTKGQTGVGQVRQAYTLTQCPDKVVLGSGGQHGQVQVDHPRVEGCVGDEVVVNVSFHRENFTHQQKDQEAEEGSGHFTDDLSLRKKTLLFYFRSHCVLIFIGPG